MEISKVKTVFESLNKFDYLSKDSDYITVTEWTNGEGWDICINNNTFQLTLGQLEAINYLTKTLEYDK